MTRGRSGAGSRPGLEPVRGALRVGSAQATFLLVLFFIPLLGPIARVLDGGSGASAADAASPASFPVPDFRHSPPSLLNSTSPPPASTGGFGEDSCAFCHSDFDENEEGGIFELLGLPEAGYRPGETLQLELRLRHPELRRGGFQLTARFQDGAEEGEQAGSLKAGEGQRLQSPGYTSTEYLGHALDGIEPTEPGERRWRFEWTAPPSAAGSVVFHGAGNAADGDEMEWGDRVYTLEVVLPPRD